MLYMQQQHVLNVHSSMSFDVLASLCTCFEYFNIAVSIAMPIYQRVVITELNK